MPAPNPYVTAAADLTAQSVDVLAAFANAVIELNAQGCGDTFFLEIAFQAGKIIREWDGSVVAGLSQAEQWRLYPQLQGLFNLAMRNKLYP